MPQPSRFSARFPLLLLGIALLGTQAARAQTPSPVTDPTALVRHAVALRLAEDASHSSFRFVFHKQDARRIFTQEIMESRQGDVARLVAVNGKPLTTAANQLEINRLHTLAANPALQQHRFHSEQADQARIDKLLRMLPDAFLYRYVGMDPCQVTMLPQIPIPGVDTGFSYNGPLAPVDPCYHLTFTPNPHWNPPDLASHILQGMAGDIWIDSSGDRLHRLTAHLVSDVAFGWGIVGRLNKGGTVSLEQDRLSGNDWELTRMKLDLTGKILLVKSLVIHIDETMGGFQPVPRMDYQQAIQTLLASPPAP